MKVPMKQCHFNPISRYKKHIEYNYLLYNHTIRTLNNTMLSKICMGKEVIRKMFWSFLMLQA